MLTVPEVKKLLKQGYTDAEIGEVFGCSRYQVVMFRQANDIPSSHHWKGNKKAREIHKLRNKCRNQTELAHKVGLSQNRVSEILSENGIAIEYKKQIKCKKCGKKFLPSGKEKICSEECRNSKESKCEICGTIFLDISTKKTCSQKCEEKWKSSKILKQKDRKRDDRNKRRGYKNNSRGHFTEKQFKETLEYFDWKCAYTGEPILGDLSNCHREHVIPISKGGDNGIWNIVPSLDWVNLSKYNRELEEWYRKQSYFSEDRLNKIYEYIGTMEEKYECTNSTEKPLENNNLEVDIVVELLKKGMNDTIIGAELGYTTNQIYRFRKQNDIPNFKFYNNLKQVEEIHKLRNKCRTKVEMAERLNMSVSALHKILEKNNIEFVKKKHKTRKRKFGTWTIINRLEDGYVCKCDCGNEELFNHSEIINNKKCQKCKFINPIKLREKKFLADYKRAEKVKQKDLSKRGKTYIINSVSKIDELGEDTYVNLICTKGHMTKNKFSRYDGCNICK